MSQGAGSDVGEHVQMLPRRQFRKCAALASLCLAGTAAAWVARSPAAPAQSTVAPVVLPGQQPRYQYRPIHDPDGTGRFYMGREIARVMGPGGLAWLDRPERESEEHPELVIAVMDLRPGEVVADLGAGSGYFTFRIAPKVAPAGKVFAVDIQDAMLATLRQRAAELGVANVVEVKATETDPRLPAHSLDAVLLVDVYHELAYPFEVMSRVREALKPGGQVFFVEYRKEDPTIRIKVLHKMSVDQLVKEMTAVGLVHVATNESLPLQHIVIFQKP